ncbi:hypothetical protein GCM10027085_14980 [Spirosoma aerophilum]
MVVYGDLYANQLGIDKPSGPQSSDKDRVMDFHITFERNNYDTKWREMTPLRFTN